MSRTGKVLAGVAIALPALTALLAVRPVDAASPEGFGSFGLTVTAAAVRTEGVVGASGGLVTLDSGTAFATGRLDSGPSSYVLADPVEPGTLARTLVGTVNTEAGTTVLAVPDAEAAYPGNGKDTGDYAPAQTAGPLTVVPGAATATAGPQAAESSTTGTVLAVAGGPEGSRLAAASSLSGDAATGRGEALGTSRVGSLELAGVLSIQDVVATAKVVVTGGRPVATAILSVGSATVVGVPVTIDSDGVHAAGQGTGLGPVQDAQSQVDEALAAAGLSVRAVNVTRTVTGRSGYADTGGLRVRLATPDLPGGIAANALTVTLGKVTVTGTSVAAAPVLELPPVDLGGPFVPGTPGTTVTTVLPGSPAVGGALPATTVPELAPAGSVVQIAGRRVSVVAALAAFGIWQLLALSTTTLYALVDRRRRLQEAQA